MSAGQELKAAGIFAEMMTLLIDRGLWDASFEAELQAIVLPDSKMKWGIAVALLSGVKPGPTPPE